MEPDEAAGGQQRPEPANNRYAHLIAANQVSEPRKGSAWPTRLPSQANQAPQGQVLAAKIPATNSSLSDKSRPTPGSATRALGHRHSQQNTSFSTLDLGQQWTLFRERLMEKAEQPENQRLLIMVIVCCALLLDNMLYMVIVPIIPDYLRSIGAWSTYTENAQWIRTNDSRLSPGALDDNRRLQHEHAKRHHNPAGHHHNHHQQHQQPHSGPNAAHWVRVSGQVVYEGEDSAVGFLFASKAIVQLFVNPFSGAIIDRIGYEIPMMIGLIVMFFSTMVFACGQTYSVLFLARSLQGVGSAFADTAGLAMIADRFSEEADRQRALGIALAFISFGCLVAPPFGSVLYEVAGKEVPFIILSLVCLLDGSLLLLVTPPGTFNQLLPVYFVSKPEAAQFNYRASKEQVEKQEAAVLSVVGGGTITTTTTTNTTNTTKQPLERCSRDQEMSLDGEEQVDEVAGKEERKQARSLQRQKSLSRRHSMTIASAGEAPKGTPIYVLLRDPCIACCAGALVVANISLAFLEPTISIWVQNTMPDTEEWQLGMIWLPAFVPHVFGVYLTVRLADKYPRYQWLIAAIGLLMAGLACLLLPFSGSFWSLIVPISIICFGMALIDTAILPTLGYLVDSRYVSVYGSIYAIADISYSLSYALGPMIAGGIVEAIGFTALNLLIALVTLGYVPVLTMLSNIHDYEPLEEAGLSAAGSDCAPERPARKPALAPPGRRKQDALSVTIVEQPKEAPSNRNPFLGA